MMREKSRVRRRVRTRVALFLSLASLAGLYLIRLLGAALPPSIVTESRNGLHVYWLAHEGESLASHLEVNLGLIAAFGGDPKSKDLARVLRTPCTQNLKEATRRPTSLLTSGSEPDDLLSYEHLVEVLGGHRAHHDHRRARTGAGPRG